VISLTLPVRAYPGVTLLPYLCKARNGGCCGDGIHTDLIADGVCLDDGGKIGILVQRAEMRQGLEFRDIASGPFLAGDGAAVAGVMLRVFLFPDPCGRECAVFLEKGSPEVCSGHHPARGHEIHQCRCSITADAGSSHNGRRCVKKPENVCPCKIFLFTVIYTDFSAAPYCNCLKVLCRHGTSEAAPSGSKGPVDHDGCIPAAQKCCLSCSSDRTVEGPVAFEYAA